MPGDWWSDARRMSDQTVAGVVTIVVAVALAVFAVAYIGYVCVTSVAPPSMSFKDVVLYARAAYF